MTTLREQNLKKYPIELVEDYYIDYWSNHHIGGSGLSVSLQKQLRDMSIEIKQYRSKANTESN